MQLNSNIVICALIIALLFGLSSRAQSVLKGQVFDNTTKRGIPGVKVVNTKKQKTVLADSLGRFTIDAGVGDVITYSATAYLTDTVYLINLNAAKIYLELNQTLLKEVKIQSARTNLGDMAIKAPPGPFGGHTLVYTTDRAGNPIGGLTLKLFDGGTSKKKRSNEKIQKEELQQTISKLFSAQNLKNYLHIEGQEMQNFVILYMPSVSTYLNNFNLALYVDSCYKEFLKIPAEKRQAKEFLELH